METKRRNYKPSSKWYFTPAEKKIISSDVFKLWLAKGRPPANEFKRSVEFYTHNRVDYNLETRIEQYKVLFIKMQQLQCTGELSRFC
ncbi:hypothetical protein V4F87_003284 [Vibrio parahaemolyticus]|nr:hypothetical protein [Vibrio parahaemolyticus]